jgi:hypothetical protein
MRLPLEGVFAKALLPLFFQEVYAQKTAYDNDPNFLNPSIILFEYKGRDLYILSTFV